jgi:hypothetical protein
MPQKELMECGYGVSMVQVVSFIVYLSTGASRLRKPACVRTPSNRYYAQG